MIVTLLLMAGAGAATYGGEKGIKKLWKKFVGKRRDYRMGPLPDYAWQNLKKHIIDKCKGFMYADALIENTLKAGYYLPALQCYELRDIYKSKGWFKDSKAHVDRITDYEYICKFDAADKIFEFLTEPHSEEKLLLKSGD